MSGNHRRSSAPTSAYVPGGATAWAAADTRSHVLTADAAQTRLRIELPRLGRPENERPPSSVTTAGDQGERLTESDSEGEGQRGPRDGKSAHEDKQQREERDDTTMAAAAEGPAPTRSTAVAHRCLGAYLGPQFFR